MEIVTDVITVSAASAAQTAKIQCHIRLNPIRVKGIYLWQSIYICMSALRASSSFVNPFLPICQPNGLLSLLRSIFYRYVSPTGFISIRHTVSTYISALRALSSFLKLFLPIFQPYGLCDWLPVFFKAQRADISVARNLEIDL